MEHISEMLEKLSLCDRYFEKPKKKEEEHVKSHYVYKINLPKAIQHWSNHLICQLLGKPPSHPPNAVGLNKTDDYCNK